jgi:Fe-S cluster biosynthesis and repair protein YggX
MAFIRAIGNGIVTLFNLVVITTMVAFAAYAASQTLLIDESNKTDLEVFVPAPIEVDKRVDIEYFLIDPQEYEQEFCMAQNIYFEASIDNKAGMAGVADVVLNRVKDKRYPNSVCEVVYQAVMKESWKTKQYPDLKPEERVYYPKRNMCQFSWYCDGKSDDIPLGSENWVKAQMVAWEIMHNNTLRGISDGATHYHATYVKPIWRKDIGMALVGRIGSHIFYRWN